MRLNRGSLRFKSGAACGVVLLGLVTACGGGAAAPTPTPVPSAGVSAVPAASPQRPPLASPAASPSTAGGSAATPAPTSAEAAGGGETYEVQSGDTLAIISNQFYGDPTQWRRIYDANKDTIGPDPDKLKIGMKLTIPPKQ